MITNVMTGLSLDKTWHSIDLKTLNDCYLIAIKNSKAAADTIDPQTIEQIDLEIGIESGITSKPITIGYATLNFNDVSSSDESINSITAFKCLQNMPLQFFIKVVALRNSYKTYTEGKTSIDINVNSISVR